MRGKAEIIFTPTFTRLWRVDPPPSRGRKYKDAAGRFTPVSPNMGARLKGPLCASVCRNKPFHGLNAVQQAGLNPPRHGLFHNFGNSC